MRLQGRIIDADTDTGVPSATIELWTDNIMLKRAIADSKGSFTIETASTPDTLKVSSAGYESASWPFNDVADDSLFPLDKFVKEEGNVTVEAGPKNKFPWWLVAAAAVLIISNNERR